MKSDRQGLPVLWVLAPLACAGLLAGCATRPARPPETLEIACRPPAIAALNSAAISGSLSLGPTPIAMQSVSIPNTVLLNDSLRRGKPEESTTVTLEKLQQVAGFSVSLQAAEEPALYEHAPLAVPPWKHSVDLGFPSQTKATSKIGVDFAMPGAPSAYTLKIQRQQVALPTRMELPEGRYIFQLVDDKGRAFSGLLELFNSDAEFVRFAFVPVFQKITPSELAEIGKREREPRLYTTSVDGKGTPLANVWLGSRTSTEAIRLGDSQVKNIDLEVEFGRGDARLLVDNQSTPPRFFVAGSSRHYLTVLLPAKDGPAVTNVIYGALDVPLLKDVTATLTSFEINISDDDVRQIVSDHKVIKKYGVYQAPEAADRKVVVDTKFGSYQAPELPAGKTDMYVLTLGERKQLGMEKLEEPRR